jgi:hypothetical protein
MRIFQDKLRVISERDIWVCICEGYLYVADTLEDLIRVLNSEWKHDKHLVG